jgi:hypothetical protein
MRTLSSLSSRAARAMLTAALLGACAARADTGDILDDALPAATNQYWCDVTAGGFAGAVWADVDADGSYDTQVVMSTLSGEAAIEPEFTSGKWYFHSQIDAHCGGSYPYHQRGRFRFHFVDILAPGFVWDDPSTWAYKAIPALSLRLSNDGCFSYSDPRYDDPAVHPQHVAQAYRELGQSDHVATVSGYGVHNVADVAGTGIKELNVTTDFCESILDDLILCNDAASANCNATPPAAPGVVLAFDVSGSMGWAHDGTPGVPPDEQRLSFAKEAASAFLTVFNDHGGGVADFGIVGFPNHPQSGCNAGVVAAMTLADDASTTAAITGTIPGLTAQGSTPLLAGLATGLGLFSDQIQRAVVVLSDGYHNCPSSVTVSDPAVLAVINDAVAASASVHTIGFGRPTDIDHPLLEALASETGGSFQDVTSPAFDPAAWDPATALAKAYTEILADSLGLETGLDPLAVLVPGKPLADTVAINEHDTKVSVVVTWRTLRTGHVQVALRASDGTSVPASGAGVRRRDGDTYTVWTLDRAFLSAPGKVGADRWQLELWLPKAERPEPVHYTVLMESDLKLALDFEPRRLATGEQPRLTARLLAGGRPLPGAEVNVRVARPDASFGTWLAERKADVPVTGGGSIPGGRADNLSPLARKLRLLVDKQGMRLPSLETSALKLLDDGTQGDARARDGAYTAIAERLRFDGRHVWHVVAEGRTAGGTPFRREARVERWIRALASAKNTAISVQRRSVDANRAELVVHIVPRDLFGNHLGPNLGGFIRVRPSWGRPLGEVVDNLDGSYEQTVAVPASLEQPVALAISIQGVEMTAAWRPGGPTRGIRPERSSKLVPRAAAEAEAIRDPRLRGGSVRGAPAQ